MKGITANEKGEIIDEATKETWVQEMKLDLEYMQEALVKDKEEKKKVIFQLRKELAERIAEFDEAINRRKIRIGGQKLKIKNAYQWEFDSEKAHSIKNMQEFVARNPEYFKKEVE